MDGGDEMKRRNGGRKYVRGGRKGEEKMRGRTGKNKKNILNKRQINRTKEMIKSEIK